MNMDRKNMNNGGNLKNGKICIKSNLIALLALILLTITDQFTKYLAALNLKGTTGIVLIPNVFRLYYLENRGAAFGTMQGKFFLLIPISLIALGLFIFFYERFPFTKKLRLFRICLAVLASGALGNMIDRIFRQYVIDFFYFELIDFPVFNVADCYVCVSMAVLAILLLFYYKEEDFKR